MKNDPTRITAPILALVAVLAAAPLAASVEVSREVDELGPTTGLRIEDGAVLLSLEEAIAMALERNLTLAVERYRQDEADLNLRRTFGIYDVNATISSLASEENSPAATNLAGADIQVTQSKRLDFTFDQLVASGGQFQVDLLNGRSDTNSTFATLNPAYRTDFDVTFSQPLLRDFGRGQTERGIRIARINREISRETFEAQVNATIQLVDDAYWTLVEAIGQLAVAEESLALAKQLHEQNRIRVEVGTLAPLELTQSEAGVATRQEEIIRARAAVGDAEDRLRQLLNLESGALWETPIVPDTEADMQPIEIDLEGAMATAIDERPALRSKRLSQDNLEADIGYFQNQKLPRLDLSLTYGLNGQGGDVTERDFFTQEILRQAAGEYDDALQQIRAADFEGWSVALTAAFPLQNRTARADAALAEAVYERGAAELRDQELAVITEVRRLARFVESSAQARESARVSRHLEEKNLDAEQKRYENGMSTSFQVLQIQEDLTEARQREVSAITGYRKAVTLFHQATGELADKRNVEIVGE